MPDITTIKDKSSAAVPSVAESRASQKKGSEGKGTNPSDTKLNECQGHDVETRE